MRLERIAALTQPIALVDAGGATLLVAQRDGIVMALRQGAAATRVLDISADTTAEGERGLLGLALSPERTRLYAGYTDKAGNTAVDEFAFTAPATVDAASRRRVLSVEQPFANHNGGQLAFGPDGLLYVALGDGGSAGDPQGNGQRLDTLLGKILRIDPRPGPGGAPYQVPADNPFVGVAGARPEIWISGVRNPWRFSFDRATGDLWIGDVGQNALEEIDRLPAGPGGAGKGANLGWSLYEGSRPFGSNTAPPAGLTGPVFEYGRSRGCSVTGGYVYRGAAIPSLVGAYVFGDFCESKVRTLRLDAAGRAVDEAPLGPTLPAGSLAAFGEDAAGELYVLSLAEGAVHKLVAGSR
ncbi:MAG: PQQ-dependent sugar dehydrogenase [Acidimicrobiales bacterium]